MTEAWVQSLFDEEPEVYGPSEKPKAHARTAKGVQAVARVGKSAERGGNWASLPELHETAGAPPLDWWNVSEEEVHRRLILAMCPERVCRTCGEPSRRIVDRYRTIDGVRRNDLGAWNNAEDRDGLHGRYVTNQAGIAHTRIASVSETLGFSDCGHDDWRPGVVLDPFA